MPSLDFNIANPVSINTPVELISTQVPPCFDIARFPIYTNLYIIIPSWRNFACLQTRRLQWHQGTHIEEKRHIYKQVASISARGPQLLPHGDTSPLSHPTMFPNATPTGVPGITRIGTTLPLIHLNQASRFVMQSPTVPCLPVAHIYPFFQPRSDKRHLPLCQHAKLLSNCGATFHVPRKVVL
jgi:hypothetical protein